MKKLLTTLMLVAGLSALAQTKALYSNDFEKAEAGKLPDELMSLGGEFAVKSEGTNKFLELPGAPLEMFGVQFGPVQKDNVAVTARILGTLKGRRTPTFGVGLGGVSGWKLQVSPAKRTIELLKDQESKASVAFDWKGGDWTHLRLQIRKVKDGEWQIEGRAWAQGAIEPKTWMISATEAAPPALDEAARNAARIAAGINSEPVAGKASVFGSPFSGTPIGFDDFVVEPVQ